MQNRLQPTKPIEMACHPRRFYQGVAAGSEVIEAHAEIDFPDQETRLALFHFYAGVLAASKYQCTTQEDFSSFLVGLSTRTPQTDED